MKFKTVSVYYKPLCHTLSKAFAMSGATHMVTCLL